MKQHRLKNGNSKLYKVWVFDLPAIESCLNCSSCKSTCYSVRAQQRFPNTRNWRAENYELARNDRSHLYGLLCSQLNTIGQKQNQVVRIHSSGDFFEQSYIDMWRTTIARYPAINFYAYTKVNEILDFTSIEQLQNFNLIPSFIDGHLNYGSLEYIKRLEKNYGAFICPATVGENIKCNRECSYCTTEKKPVFLIHGSGRKKKKIQV